MKEPSRFERVSLYKEIIEVDAHPVAGIRHFLIRESLCLVEDV